MDTTEKTWDIIVVGGGPAGMMAAGQGAKNGASVILIEKNSSLGKKLLITGGGRCNVTNAQFDTRKLLEKFKDNSKYLFSAFSQWNVKETIDFFNERKMETKIEKENRVFPVSNKAQSVWNVLVEFIKEQNVTILSNSPVTDILLSPTDPKTIIGVQLRNKKQILGKKVIIATGGTSRPETGSTGDGYRWLKKIGHSVSEPTASLVPIALSDPWISRLAGMSMDQVKLTIWQNETKQSQQKGKILFTHIGLSGPTILNMSKEIGELLKYGDVKITLDSLPTLDHGQLNTKLQEIFKENDKKKFKNSLSTLIPSSLAPIVVELSGINPDIQCNSITRPDRMKLIDLLKGIPMHVSHLLGLEKAIISSGGVSLDEVDFKTMQSRLYPNLYLIGDVLNIDRPSGGYSLQLCWTTGFVAGVSASSK